MKKKKILFNQKIKKKYVLFLAAIFLTIQIVITVINIAGGINGNYYNDEMDKLDIIKFATVYYEDSNNALAVHTNENYAYVADGSGGLVIMDISNLADPETIIYQNTNESIYDVYVRGEYAYVAESFNGLGIIDISNPSNLEPTVYQNTYGDVQGIYLKEDYAYVADGFNGLGIINISNPTNPGTPVYQYTDGTAYDIYVNENYAYLADGSYGLVIIDISDPNNPGTPVYQDTNGQATGVYVSGNYAYIADGLSGLAIIDVSDPNNPSPPIYLDTSGITQGIHINGDRAYVADYESGLVIINISVPTDPEILGIQKINGHGNGVYMSGDNIFIATGESGLAVLDINTVDITDPEIIDAPEDTITGEFGIYKDQSISWVASDLNPSTYTIDRQLEDQERLIVVNSTIWIDGSTITYNIPNNLSVGDYIYTITFTDSSGNYVFDSIIFSVADTISPEFTEKPEDIAVEYGYTDQSISWKATDSNQDYYFIYLNGKEFAVNITNWSSDSAITYNIPEQLGVGEYVYTIYFVDISGNAAIDSMIFSVVDLITPNITATPDDITVELGYIDQSISWKATDLNNATYTIELQGDGIVVVPTNWSSGSIITYDIPEGFGVGNHVYKINFTDLGGNVITDNVTFTVIDTTMPKIRTVPVDISGEYGSYTGQSISWNATDLDSSMYAIEYQGMVIVSGEWISGSIITYDIPENLIIGEHVYTITFTDGSENYETDSVTFTVEDTTIPKIKTVPGDISGEYGSYTGQSISWNATDLDSSTYAIEYQGMVIVSDEWISGSIITYDIPENHIIGEHVYIITFTDGSENYETDSVTFTVEDTTIPKIKTVPGDISGEYGSYKGQSISWNATDLDSSMYAIEYQGMVIVSGEWISSSIITYDIPENHVLGEHVYIITFTDGSENYKTDSVTFTVEDTKIPLIIAEPGDVKVEIGYTGQSLSWNATDLDSSTYAIEYQGEEIVSGIWNSGSVITYDIPDNHSLGDHFYIITFMDGSGNIISDSMTFTVEEVPLIDTGDPFMFIIITIGVLSAGGIGITTGMIALRKRR